MANRLTGGQAALYGGVAERSGRKGDEALPGTTDDRLVHGLHHIQLAMPKGEEAAARGFYCDVLGFDEVEKPDHLKPRGGCWFESGNVVFHLGVDSDFRSAKKAHPAFVVRSLAELKTRLESANYQIVYDTQIFGYNRFYSNDPFGNRLEFLEPA